jgi:hypothetical protein
MERETGSSGDEKAAGTSAESPDCAVEVCPACTAPASRGVLLLHDLALAILN